MAEAMCGPSNALQQFKQQTSQDRSLQQDRFTNRRQPAQGFRSVNAYAGHLDPEFEAFQAGRSITPVLDHGPAFQAPARFGTPPSHARSWADDFQRLSIAPAPQSHLQQQPQLFPAGPASASWAQGFRDQFKQNAPRAVSPSPLAFQQMAQYGSPGFQSSFMQPSFAPDVQSAKGKAPVTDAFDEAAFERAFDMAREDLMADEDVAMDQVADRSVAESIETTLAHEEVSMMDFPGTMDRDVLDQFDAPDLTSAPLQPLHETPIEDQHDGHNDDDALAATAQELLEKVEHNRSDKFKNSQFLGLMRKLADRQVRVEGDKMVETADAAAPSYAGPAPNSLNTDTRYIPGVADPLARHANIFAPAEQNMPHAEQDHDPGRIDPRDGEDVVNLLNDSGLAERLGPYKQPRTGVEDIDFNFGLPDGQMPFQIHD